MSIVKLLLLKSAINTNTLRSTSSNYFTDLLQFTSVHTLQCVPTSLLYVRIQREYTEKRKIKIMKKFTCRASLPSTHSILSFFLSLSLLISFVFYFFDEHNFTTLHVDNYTIIGLERWGRKEEAINRFFKPM